MKVPLGRTRLYAPLLIMAVLGLLIEAGPGYALFLSPAQKCQLGKIKVAGKYHFCRIKVIAKAFKFGTTPDFSRCDQKLLKKWVVLEERAIAKGIPCPTEGDLAYIQTRLTNDSARVGMAVSSIRFIDNEDGTISDAITGLMWERKELGGGCLHCVDDVSTWVDLADWLSMVNGHTNDPEAQVGLGGYSDWRLPSIGELQTLLLEPFPCSESPCVDSALGPAPTVLPLRCWSSTSSAATPTAAWYVDFDDGLLEVGGKMGSGVYFRAVRDGL